MALSFKVFNVGQGDHMLVELPENQFGIIDSFYDDKDSVCLPKGVAYLDQKNRELVEAGESKIEILFIIITHFDFDHVKGFQAIMDWIELNEIKLHNLYISPSKRVDRIVKLINQVDNNRNLHLKRHLRRTLEFLEKHKRIITHIRTNSPYLSRFQDRFSIQGIGPTDEIIEHFFDNLASLASKKKNQFDFNRNKLSGILELNFTLCDDSTFAIFIGGDSDAVTIKKSIAKFSSNNENRELEYDVIKVPHHGAKSSSSLDIWKDLSKKRGTTYALNSASINNKYQHPHGKTINDIRLLERDHSDRKIIFACTSTEDFDSPNEPVNKIDFDMNKYYSEELIAKLKNAMQVINTSQQINSPIEDIEDSNISKVKLKKMKLKAGELICMSIDIKPQSELQYLVQTK